MSMKAADEIAARVRDIEALCIHMLQGTRRLRAGEIRATDLQLTARTVSHAITVQADAIENAADLLPLVDMFELTASPEREAAEARYQYHADNDTLDLY